LPKVFDELKNFTEGKSEVIISDDASTDDSLSVLNELAKDHNIKVLLNEKNRGFAPTVNKGVKAASGEIIILLNTDIYPEKDFLEPLLAHFKEKQVFAVGV